VTFRNENNNPLYANAELFYKDSKSFGRLQPGGQLRFKTFKGHEWNIKADGETLLTYKITGEEEEEVHVI
jgi:urease accessory protein UreH